jgi:hypothetical protein
MPNRGMLRYEFALLAGLVSALTIGAWWIYPIWDDGRLLFWSSQLGDGAIYHNYGDRPLLAYLYTFLFRHQLFQPVGLIFHWISWFAMGLVTIRFWRLMFPAYSQFALLPALLAVAPVLGKCQLATFTIVFPVMTGPLVIFISLFLMLSDQPSVLRRVLVSSLALILIAFAVLITNYAVTTAAVVFVVISAKAFKSPATRKRELLISAGLTAFATLCSYAAFCWLTRLTATPEYRPGYALTSLPWKITVVPFRLLSAVWRSTIGGVLESLGAVALNTKPTLLSFACGIALGALAWLVISRKNVQADSHADRRFSFITLLTATALALLPVFLMGRTFEGRWDTRFIVPILPVLSSLTVFILFSVVRKRLWMVVPILCGFLAGYWTTFEIANAIRNPEPVVTLPQQHEIQDRNVLESVSEIKIGNIGS